MAKVKKEKFELTADMAKAIKVDILEGSVLQAIKDKVAAAKMPKVSPTALSMSERMMKDINAGARIALTTTTLQNSKDNIKKLLRKDLARIAKKAKKNYNVKIVDEGQNLVFYFEEKAPKKDKSKKD